MKLLILFIICTSSFLYAENIIQGVDHHISEEQLRKIQQDKIAYMSSFDTSCMTAQLQHEVARGAASEMFEVEVCGSDIYGISSAIGAVEGCEVLYKHHPDDECVVVRMPQNEDDLKALCAMPMVEHIQSREQCATSRDTVSEGDIAHRADLARAFGEGATGKGVRVGILSDCVDPIILNDLIASGDLKSLTVITDPETNQTQNIFDCRSEGTAMAEIVFDLAPDAELFFASAAITRFQMGRNIKLLRYEYDCDIIIDDYMWFTESPFQDDNVAQAVDDVSEDGALYFAFAGNFRFKSYSADFDPVIQSPGVAFHNFELFAGFPIATITTFFDTFVWLYWSDAYGSEPIEDYDFIAINMTTNEIITDFFTFPLSRGPLRLPTKVSIIPAGVSIGFFIANFNYTATSQRRIRVFFANRDVFPFPANIWGHAAAKSAFTVAASPVGEEDPTLPFNSSRRVEFFSSVGPTHIFFDTDGNILEEGVYTAAQGGEVRMKPEFTAADGVSTSTPGFNPFFGTSAAATHLGAIAALVVEKSGITARSYVKTVFKLAAIDIEFPGFDIASGYGIVDALTSVQIAQGAKPYHVFPRYPKSRTLGFKNHPNYECPEYLSEVDVFSKRHSNLHDVASLVQESDDGLALYASKFSYSYHKYPLSLIFDIPIDGSYLLSGGHTIQDIYNHTVAVSISYKVEAEFHVSKKIRFAALVPGCGHHSRPEKIDLGYIDTYPGYSKYFEHDQVFSSNTLGSVLNQHDHVHLEVSIHDGLHKQITIDALSIHVICP